jgi:hypothetical protein
VCEEKISLDVANPTPNTSFPVQGGGEGWVGLRTNGSALCTAISTILVATYVFGAKKTSDNANLSGERISLFHSYETGAGRILLFARAKFA